MSDKTNVLILAGQREGVKCLLCAQAGIEWKALLPVLGKPMTDYVHDAVSGTERIKNPFYISGINKNLLSKNYKQSPSGSGPAGSIVAAVEAGLPYPFMVTTCDHPLLIPEIVDYFLREAVKTDADFVIGLATRNTIHRAYPHTKRTYLKFRDQQVSGCNLFFVGNEDGLEAIRFWRAAQHDRKKPWKLAMRFGTGGVLAYLSGRLTLDDAFIYASRSLKIKIKPVLIPFAEAAIDVDKPADLELVESIMKRRK